MVNKDELVNVAGKARAAQRAVARALRRPKTYRGAVKEALWTGVNLAVYPVGMLSKALEPESSNGSLGGRYTHQLPLHYLSPDAASTPIVMVHGYFHNRSAFLVFRRALRRTGFRHIQMMNYGVIGHSVMDLAERLAARVDQVLADTGATRVHIVGHSLGGLIARTYIQLLGGEDKVHTCVTLGTPHGGTYAAIVAPGKAAHDLRPGSPLIRRLEETIRPVPVRFACYYSNLDGLVIPASSAKLTHPDLNAHNILVRDQGHMSLLISSPLIRSVTHTLSHLDRWAPEHTVEVGGNGNGNGATQAEGA